MVTFYFIEEPVILGSAHAVDIYEINMIIVWQRLALFSCSENFCTISRPNKTLNYSSSGLPFPLLNIDHVLGIKFFNELEFTA